MQDTHPNGETGGPAGGEASPPNHSTDEIAARGAPRSSLRRFAASAAFVPLAASLPLMVLLAEGDPKIKPIVWVSLAVIAVIGLRAAFAMKRHRWLDFVLVGLVGVAATHVLFYPGFPQGHDIITHLWGTYAFYQEILAGNPLPRWLHHLGLGMPFLMFYPPLAFYLLLPFLLAGAPVYDAFKYGFVLFNALSGISMYYVVRHWTSSRRAALVAAVAYCFAPYHLLESNYRVAIAEAAGLIILPLFFYSLHRALSHPDRRSWRKATFWVAALTVTHPLSLSMGGTAMGIWVLATHRWRLSIFRPLGMLALLGILGLTLAGFYTVPLAAEAKYTSITSSMGGGKPIYAKYGLLATELVERRAWTHWQRAEPRGSKSEDNEMPFYFGITLLALIPLARDPRHKDVVRGLRAITLGGLVLSLYPMDVVFARFPPMTMLQFPWRFLTVATCGASALAGFATLRLLQNTDRVWLRRAIPGALVALMLFDFFPYQGAASWAKPYDGIYRLSRKMSVEQGVLPLRVDHLSYPPSHGDIQLSLLRRVYPEYFSRATRRAFKNAKGDEQLERVSVGITFKKAPRGRVLNPAPYAEFFPADGGHSRGLEFSRGGERIRVRLPGEEGRLEIKEQWFPGWIVDYGGFGLEVQSTKDGLMRMDLDPGDTGEITLYFSRTRWDRLLGILLTAATVLGLWWPRRRRVEPGAAEG